MPSDTLALTIDLGVYIIAVDAYYVATRYFHCRRFSTDTWKEGSMVFVLFGIVLLVRHILLDPFWK